MHRLLFSSLAGMLAVALPMAGPAHAQPEADTAREIDRPEVHGAREADSPESHQYESDPPEARPGDSTVSPAHRLTLPAGMLALVLPVNLNLSSDTALEPVSLSPDIWYGVTDELGIGLTHSFHGATGFLGFDGIIGTGVCVTGEAKGCARVYDNVGIEGLYRLAGASSWELAGNAGLQVGSFDPFTLSFKVGVAGMWRPRPFDGRLGLMANPILFIGITERDGGNDESIGLPITARYAITDAIHGLVQTGIGFDLDGFGDSYFVPLSLAGHYLITTQWTAGGVFSLPLLVTGDGFDGGGLDARTLTLVVSYRR